MRKPPILLGNVVEALLNLLADHLELSRAERAAGMRIDSE
jgi:hypothetical protein